MIVLQRIKLSRVRSTMWHRIMFTTWHPWMTDPSAEMFGAYMLIGIFIEYEELGQSNLNDATSFFPGGLLRLGGLHSG